VTTVSIEFAEKKHKEIKKVVITTKLNTNRTALATQVKRQVEKKAYTHDTDS